MNAQLQLIISFALGSAMLFAVIYCISLAIGSYRKWLEEREDDKPIEVKPVLDEVKRVTPVAPKAPPPEMTEEAECVPEFAAEDPPPVLAPEAAGGELFTEEMTAPVNRAQKEATAYEAARFSRMAYNAGRLVEAYHFAAIARLCGHERLASMMSQIRINWRLAGFPDEKYLCDERFDSVRSAIGRAMLRIDSKHETERGYACLTDLASSGNELARDLLKSLPPWR